MRGTPGTFRLENMTVLFQVQSEKGFFSFWCLCMQRAGTVAHDLSDASLVCWSDVWTRDVHHDPPTHSWAHKGLLGLTGAQILHKSQVPT